MSAVGGPIESVELDGRRFAVAGDADGNRKLGGTENEIQSNGDGTARIVKTRVPWMLDGITVEVNDDRGDQEFLQTFADNKEFKPVTITLASGAIYSGRGIVSGEVQFSTMSSTAELSLSGEGSLTKQ